MLITDHTDRIDVYDSVCSLLMDSRISHILLGLLVKVYYVPRERHSIYPDIDTVFESRPIINWPIKFYPTVLSGSARAMRRVTFDILGLALSTIF